MCARRSSIYDGVIRNQPDTTYKEVVMVTEVRRPIIEEEAVDLGGATDTAMVEVGDKLGLYKAISEAGPVTSAELAELTGLPWRYIRVWLGAQAAGDFLDYDEATGRYSAWCSWPRGPADGHTYTGDAVRRFVN
jgi:hypothetical protein